jgi:hypothetical protein
VQRVCFVFGQVKTSTRVNYLMGGVVQELMKTQAVRNQVLEFFVPFFWKLRINSTRFYGVGTEPLSLSKDTHSP